MLDARSVAEGMDHLGQVETSWSWVLADRSGNIGFQMSGLVPRRAGTNGLVPLPGWKKENDWLGFLGHEELPRAINPERGYLVTANHDLNALGRSNPINVAMAPYRADRIARLLEEDKKFTPADMVAMHFDVYSLQAEAMMNVLRPLLPDTPQGRLLADWDLRYTLDSRGAFLFEAFYGRLLREVFGRGGLGTAAIDHLAVRSGIFVAYHFNFDRVLLAERSAWFGGRSRDEIYRSVAAEALRIEPRPWGHGHGYMLRHLLFGGKLPALLGFDRGPVCMAGGRATIHQVQAVRSVHRTTTVVPSFRMVADLAADEIHTTLAGGPSDRRFSRWYCSDLADWVAGRYKIISAAESQERLRFP